MRSRGQTWWGGWRQSRKPASRLRQAAGLAALLLVAGGFLLYRYVTDEQRLRGYAEQWLAGFSGGEVRVTRVEVAPFGGLQLVGVTIATPEDAGFFPAGTPLAERTLFSASSVLLRLQPFSMISGDLIVPQIIAINPKLTLIERVSDGASNWEAVLARRKPGKPGGDGPSRLPEIRLRNVEVQQYRLNERGRVGGTIQTFFAGARPKPDEPEVYDLNLTKILAEGQTGNWSGEPGRLAIDMSSGAVSGSLPPLSLEELRFAASSEINRWLDVLDLSGLVIAEDFSFDPAGGTHATLKLQDARLSVPVDEQEATNPAAGRYIQFSNMAGTIRFDGHQTTVELRGLFRQSPIRLNGRMTLASGTAGGMAGIGFDVDLAAEAVPLPRCDEDTSEPEKRFVRRWKRLNTFVHDFDGRGNVDLSLRLRKEPGADKGIEFVEGRLTAKGADAAFDEFPYRLHGLTGDVQFRRDGKIDLVRLSGVHGTGRVTISGEMSGSTSHDSVNLDIIGQGIALDGDLLECLKEDDRALCRMFLERATLDVGVHMERPAADWSGPRGTWTSTVEATFLDGAFRYAAFPYPLDELRGKVRIAGGVMRLHELSGRHGEARVRVSGIADRQGSQAGRIDVKLQADSLPLDDDLAEALPADVAVLFRKYDPTGLTDISGRLFTDRPGEPLRFELNARLARASLALPGGTARLDDLEGVLRVVPDQLELTGLKGRLGNSVIGLEGRVGLSSSATTGLELRISSESLELGEPLRAALPEAVRSAYDSLSPQGRVRLDLHYRSTSGGAASRPATSTPADADQYAAVVDLLGCRFTFDKFPLPLDDVRGQVKVDPRETRFEGITGRHGGMRLSLSGRMPVEPGDVAVEITSLEARDLEFNEELRNAMPWRLKRMWNEMQPTGSCDLTLRDILVFDGPQDQRSWQLTGRVDLKQMGLSAGPVFSEVDAVVEGPIGFDGQFYANTRLELKRGQVDGRLVTDARASIRRDHGASILAIHDVLATFYGGKLLGEIDVDYATRPPTFGLNLTARDVSLEDFLNAGRGADRTPVHAKGRIDGTLKLSGRFGRPDSRQGSGSVVVHEAQMLKLPMILSILRIVHMSIDDDNAFHDALFDFMVDGDDVVLDRIDLRGKSISMVGAGRVRASSLAMHLVLLVGSPLKLPKVAILSELVEGVARELMEVHVEGTLDNPFFRAQIARSIRQTLEAMTRVRVDRNRLGAAAPRSNRRVTRN